MTCSSRNDVGYYWLTQFCNVFLSDLESGFEPLAFSFDGLNWHLGLFRYMGTLAKCLKVTTKNIRAEV